MPMEGALPFLIHGGSTNPASAGLPSGGQLVELVIEHPEPDRSSVPRSNFCSDRSKKRVRDAQLGNHVRFPRRAVSWLSLYCGHYVNVGQAVRTLPVGFRFPPRLLGLGHIGPDTAFINPQLCLQADPRALAKLTIEIRHRFPPAQASRVFHSVTTRERHGRSVRPVEIFPNPF